MALGSQIALRVLESSQGVAQIFARGENTNLGRIAQYFFLYQRVRRFFLWRIVRNMLLSSRYP